MTPSNTRPTHAGSGQGNREIFQCLSDSEAPKGALSASIGLHAVALVVLILVPLVAPQTLRVNYRTLMLAPPPEPPRHIEPVTLKLPPPPPPRPKPTPPEPIKIAEPAPFVAPKPIAPEPVVRLREIPKPAPPPIPAPTFADAKPMPALAPPAPPPVVTNVFSNSTAAPALAVPSRTTEAAGFGDIHNTRDGSRTSNLESATAAGFGEVKGSRDGGRSGSRGAVGPVSGFDVGAAGGVRGGSGRGAVMASGFGANNEAPKPSASSSPKTPEPDKNEKPVEILSKPRPEYTEEARRMRIEGEVLLRVMFTSTGEARVLDVTRGLGHGLNESAIRAAQQIRFKPAQRTGQPVDSTAIVHIVFQLAY